MTSLRALASPLLRVAHPRECNNATKPEIAGFDATARATGTQQGGLKALALLTLARNKPRNSSATTPRNATQQTPSKPTPVVARDSVACVALPRGATAQQPIIRAVVRFRIGNCEPNTWCTAIGGKPRAEIVADILQKWPDAKVLP